MHAPAMMLGCWLALLAIAPATAWSQQPTRSPHGDLAEPCAACHGPSGWKPARISRGFDHARKGFPLVGAHAATACRACHASLDFRGASRNCVGCHTDVHRGELGADCARCHTSRTFLDRSAMVQAHQATRFPLNGSHLTADCESCHTPAAQGRLTFVNRSTECVQCHLDAYQAAKNPDHVGAGFPTDCNQCHSISTWPGARFNHATTRFPLTGAHRAIPCQQCHGDGVYHGKSTACLSCHQADYDGTTDPNHRTAQFPTDCASCHTTSGWPGATFDHDARFFPVYSGAHRGKWTTCSTCHTNSANYQVFTCLTCHAQNSMDSKHNGRSGYRYDSQACYSCHPRGTGG